MDLNKHALKAQEIAINRDYFHDVPADTRSVFKHMAGEVVEAVEAYGNKADLAGELADVITCCLIIAVNEGVDIEKALEACQQKNEARSHGTSV